LETDALPTELNPYAVGLGSLDSLRDQEGSHTKWTKMQMSAELTLPSP